MDFIFDQGRHDISGTYHGEFGRRQAQAHHCAKSARKS
jgi:hypothetical protein